MKRLLPLILIVPLIGGCVWPGTYIRISPLTKTLTMWATADTTLTADHVEIETSGGDKLLIKNLGATQDATSTANVYRQAYQDAGQNVRGTIESVVGSAIGQGLGARIGRPPTTQPAGPSRMDRLEAMLERLLAERSGS